MVTEAVETLEDVTRVMSRGHQNRATASTNVHEHSSRSHSIILVNVTSAVVTSNRSCSLYSLAHPLRIGNQITALSSGSFYTL